MRLFTPCPVFFWSWPLVCEVAIWLSYKWTSLFIIAPGFPNSPVLSSIQKDWGTHGKSFDLSRLNVRWLSYGQPLGFSSFLSSAVWMAGMLARTAMAIFWFWSSTKDGKGGLNGVDQKSRNRLGQGWLDRLHANPSHFLHDSFCTRQTGTFILNYWYQVPSRWSQLHVTQIVIRFFFDFFENFSPPAMLYIQPFDIHYFTVHTPDDSLQMPGRFSRPPS